MIRILLALSLGVIAQPAFAQSVEVADIDWSTVPQAAVGSGPSWLSDASMNRIEKAIGKNQCPRFGDAKRFNLTVPFLMQIDSNNVVQRVVIQRQGCPELESVLGGVILGRTKTGYYKSTGKNQTGWYRSEISHSVN
jgi:hypothetical protein